MVSQHSLRGIRAAADPAFRNYRGFSRASASRGGRGTRLFRLAAVVPGQAFGPRAASTTWLDVTPARRLAPFTISEHHLREIFDSPLTPPSGTTEGSAALQRPEDGVRGLRRQEEDAQRQFRRTASLHYLAGGFPPTLEWVVTIRCPRLTRTTELLLRTRGSGRVSD